MCVKTKMPFSTTQLVCIYVYTYVCVFVYAYLHVLKYGCIRVFFYFDVHQSIHLLSNYIHRYVSLWKCT